MNDSNTLDILHWPVKTRAAAIHAMTLGATVKELNYSKEVLSRLQVVPIFIGVVISISTITNIVADNNEWIGSIATAAPVMAMVVSGFMSALVALSTLHRHRALKEKAEAFSVEAARHGVKVDALDLGKIINHLMVPIGNSEDEKRRCQVMLEIVQARRHAKEAVQASRR